MTVLLGCSGGRLLRRFLTIGLGILFAVSAPHLRAEGDNPPDFPPGVRPGSPPGFDGPPERVQDPQASQLGQWLANAGYGLAGILTFFSLRRLPSAAVRSWTAGRDAVHGQPIRREAERLKQWGERLEKEFPEAMGRLERSAAVYQKTMDSLSGALSELAPDGTWDSKTKEMDRHLDALLILPLMTRRTQLKGELMILIDQWKKNRDAKPLEEWIAGHREYDLIRTAKGAAWLSGYRELQRELSGLAWKERGSTAELERWITSPVSERESENGNWVRWVEAFRTHGAEERKAAAKFARDSNAETRLIFGSDARPTVSLGPTGDREPGQFLFHHTDGSEELDFNGVLYQANGICRRELAAVGANANLAARRGNSFRQLGRFVWPMAPVALGTSVGGYYSVEGIRYWLGGKETTSPASAERR